MSEAQSVDSLLQTIAEDVQGPALVDSLNKLGFPLIFKDPFIARDVFDEAIEISQNLDYEEGLAVSFKNKAISYDIQGNSNQAVKYFLRSLRIFESLKDTLGIARLKNNLGIAYKNLGDIATSRKFYQESIVLKEVLGDTKGIAYGSNNVGELYQIEGDYILALEFFSRAQSILDSIGDIRGMSIALSNMAEVYLQLEDYVRTIDLVERTITIDEEFQDQYSLSVSYLMLARAYGATNRVKEALNAISESEKMSQEIGALKVYYKSQLVKADMLSLAGAIGELPALYREILTLNDSLAKVNLAEETARVKGLYEIREKELRIAELQRESQLSQELLESQGRLSIAALVGIILLFSLLATLFILFRRGKANERELKRQIEERKKAEQEAVVANKAKSEFLANMSHEIRTPLNGIIGYTDHMIDLSKDETISKHLLTVNKAAYDLLTIINEILDFSKVESGNIVLNPTPVDISELCKQVIKIFEVRANEKGLLLKFNDSPLVGQRVVLVDALRLRQVLLNLLGNAIKFTDTGEVELIVEPTDSSGEGRVGYSFCVKDTGVGIRPENKQKIFEAFSQEDNSTTRVYGGTGLGLAISGKLLTLMGSHLDLESERGKGSRFFFELDLNLADESADESADEALAEKTEERTNEPSKLVAKQVKVLMAEDNEMNMALAKVILEKILPQGQIIEARDGEEALRKFEEHKPDLVFMDVQMPKLDGYATTREIRKKYKEIRTPIVALTAGSLKGERENCLKAGMDDYITKPIVKNAIEGIINKWLAPPR